MKAVLALVIIYVAMFFLAIQGASQNSVQTLPQGDPTQTAGDSGAIGRDDGAVPRPARQGMDRDQGPGRLKFWINFGSFLDRYAQILIQQATADQVINIICLQGCGQVTGKRNKSLKRLNLCSARPACAFAGR